MPPPCTRSPLTTPTPTRTFHQQETHPIMSQSSQASVTTPPSRAAQPPTPLWQDAGDHLSLPVPAASTFPALAALGDWYHDFDSLGIRVPQRPGIYRVNQLCKQPVILGYLQTALAKSRRSFQDRPSLLELFCADGFYSAHARRMGAGKVTGIDLDAAAIAQANAMFATLFGDSQNFLVQDIFQFTSKPPVDVLLNCGGLYHLTDPRRLIQESRPRFGARFMVLQTVVTMETAAPDYFVAPAPGWGHGCRFTTAWLHREITAAGWRIIDSHTNELQANDRPCDRGSAYLLCQWPA